MLKDAEVIYFQLGGVGLGLLSLAYLSLLLLIRKVIAGHWSPYAEGTIHQNIRI